MSLSSTFSKKDNSIYYKRYIAMVAFLESALRANLSNLSVLDSAK